MKTYQLSWGVVLIIGILLLLFKDLAQILGIIIIVISILALWKKKEKVSVSIDPNKK